MVFRRCRCVTKPCSLCLAGSLATSCGKHALKKTEASVPFGPFSKGTSNHFTRVSEATLSPSQLDGVLPLRMSRSHAAGAWPARCHTICKASHSLTFSRPALFHGPRCSRKFWAPRVGGRGGSPYKIHQLFTDYLLRLPSSELLEKHLFRSRANRRLVQHEHLSTSTMPWAKDEDANVQESVRVV